MHWQSIFTTKCLPGDFIIRFDVWKLVWISFLVAQRLLHFYEKEPSYDVGGGPHGLGEFDLGMIEVLRDNCIPLIS